ncbi:MAG TPA: hypothetical protein VFW08_10340 [bacterium]|nr:hypothetical protein [bacterium]
MKAAASVLAVLVVMGAMVILAGPEQTAAGPVVQGCASCHTAGREPTLDAAAKAIKGHPASAAKTVQQCALCHTKGPTPAPLRTTMHKVHLNSTKFASTYKGTCTSCHSVDKATGTITVFGLDRK